MYMTMIILTLIMIMMLRQWRCSHHGAERRPLSPTPKIAPAVSVAHMEQQIISSWLCDDDFYGDYVVDYDDFDGDYGDDYDDDYYVDFNLDGWIDTIIFFVTASVFCQYFLLPIAVLCVVCVLGQRMCYKCVSMSMDGRNCVAMSRTDRSPTSSSTHQTPLSTNTLLPKYINALQCLLRVFLDA